MPDRSGNSNYRQGNTKNMAESKEKTAEQFEEMRILDEMKNSYLNYAMSVIVARALPDVRDGLKPSQRRILVAMNDLNLGPRTKHRKCAKIVGDTGGNYHPHGDQATYGTLVRLGQDWHMRRTLVDPQGRGWFDWISRIASGWHRVVRAAQQAANEARFRAAWDRWDYQPLPGWEGDSDDDSCPGLVMEWDPPPKKKK